MYAGFTISGTTHDRAALAESFTQVMQNEFLASVSHDLIATALFNKLNSCYEISLTINADTGEFSLDAWGDSREVDLDESIDKLKVLSQWTDVKTLNGNFKEQEVDAEDVDLLALLLPQSWFN